VKRVLLLSVSAGAGHMRAAEAVEGAVRRLSPEAEVRHLDVLTVADPAFREAYSRWYLTLVSRAPALWGYFYEYMDRPPRQRPLGLRRALEHWNARRLREAVRSFAPDTIVCTHFLPAADLARDRLRGRLSARLGVAVTDADVHRVWVHAGVTRYFVAREEGAVYLRSVDGGHSEVEVTGIPIDLRFGESIDRAVVRQKHGLPLDGPIVLLLGGGFGVGPVAELFARLQEAERPSRLVVVTGRNETLQRALRKTAGPRATVLGFTTEIDEWMAAADLLVTKPGGLTTSEALARGLPMVLVHPIPGQEQRNADALLEAGAAVRANNLEALPWKVDALLSEPGRLQAMREAARRAARPEAALKVARWAIDAG
jgi:processive 1,2-diacylglycerol beta-glucosyltransferase